MALRVWRLVAWVLRIDDFPRGHGLWYRLSLAVCERRYTAAKVALGEDGARNYDYIPF